MGLPLAPVPAPRAGADLPSPGLFSGGEPRFPAPGRGPFAQAALDYDTFQDWDYRWSGYGGVGDEWVKTDKLFVLPRAGLGLTQEIGGSDNKIHPEALLGLDAEDKINEPSKFYFNGES